MSGSQGCAVIVMQPICEGQKHHFPNLTCRRAATQKR